MLSTPTIPKALIYAAQQKGHLGKKAITSAKKKDRYFRINTDSFFFREGFCDSSIHRNNSSFVGPRPSVSRQTSRLSRKMAAGIGLQYSIQLGNNPFSVMTCCKLLRKPGSSGLSAAE